MKRTTTREMWRVLRLHYACSSIMPRIEHADVSTQICLLRQKTKALGNLLELSELFAVF
jgi:hypothetical protein